MYSTLVNSLSQISPLIRDSFYHYHPISSTPLKLQVTKYSKVSNNSANFDYAGSYRIEKVSNEIICTCPQGKTKRLCKHIGFYTESKESQKYLTPIKLVSFFKTDFEIFDSLGIKKGKAPIDKKIVVRSICITSKKFKFELVSFKTPKNYLIHLGNSHSKLILTQRTDNYNFS